MANTLKWKAEFVQVAKAMCRLGATDIEVADALGVTVRTLHRWKSDYPDLAEAMKLGKDEADDRVEKALYASATGYEHDDVDIRVVGGQVVQTVVRRYYPPVPTSMVFWLKNRRPDVWKERMDHQHTGADGKPIEHNLSVSFVESAKK